VQKSFRIAVIGLALAVFATPVVAQSKGRGAKDKSSGAVQAQVSVDVFDAIEIRLIRDYYGNAGQKPQALPPGIAKNLRRGKPLPPGIAKKSLPSDLSRNLPVREGVELVVAGDQVVMVRAGIVIDILAIFN
jgi:hypothetical protein